MYDKETTMGVLGGLFKRPRVSDHRMESSKHSVLEDGGLVKCGTELVYMDVGHQ